MFVTPATDQCLGSSVLCLKIVAHLCFDVVSGSSCIVVLRNSCAFNLKLSFDSSLVTAVCRSLATTMALATAIAYCSCHCHRLRIAQRCNHGSYLSFDSHWTFCVESSTEHIECSALPSSALMCAYSVDIGSPSSSVVIRPSFS